MTYYYNSRYTPVRKFIADVIAALDPEFPVHIQAPAAIEPVLRSKNGKKYIHLINRASGIPVFENVRGSDEVPPVGPISIQMKCPEAPKSVRLRFESGSVDWNYDKNTGRLTVRIPSVQIHAALEIE
jgi:hypothetical protein